MRRPPRSPLFPYTTLFRSARRPAAQLLLVGGGPMEAALKAQAAASPVADRIRFTGRVPHHEVERRSEEHTSELQSQANIVCRLLLEKKKSESQEVCVGAGT